MSMLDPKNGRNTPVVGGRRGWIKLGAVGGVSLGVGVAWWFLGRQQASADRALLDEFWASEYLSAQSARVPMQSFRGRPLLLNFWATWCAPCVAELPLLDRFYRENQANGWQMLAIAIDNLAPVQAFLRQNDYAFPVVMGGAGGVALARKLGNLSGGLPFSVLIAPDGRIAYRKMGALSASELGVLRSSV